MKVQRIGTAKSGVYTWTVLGDDFLPVDPIERFLAYLRSLERSPNTVKSYSYHLKLYWEYISSLALDWHNVGLTELSNFMAWLRSPQPSGVVALHEQEARRTEATINLAVTAVCMFYDFHACNGEIKGLALYRSQAQPYRHYKSFLHHLSRNQPVRTKLLHLKESKRFPKILAKEQVKQLIEACERSRDKFLVSLLYETGMRIGQALGLRIHDIQSWDNLIQVVPRDDNSNGARSKSRDRYSVDVSKELIELYRNYLIDELEDPISDFVFVNLWEGQIGLPMTYGTVADLFRRLSCKTGIKATPHMLRHTHATELIRDGWGAAYVQKRLGHRQVQTVLNTYIHLNEEDMKEAFQDYLSKRDQNHEVTSS